MRQKRTKKQKKKGGGREDGNERKTTELKMMQGKNKQTKKPKQYALGKVRPWKRKSKNPVPNIPGDEWENRSTRRKKPIVGRS